MNWVFDNMDSQDLNAPIEEDKDESPAVDSDAIAQVMELGFDQNQATIALLKNVLN